MFENAKTDNMESLFDKDGAHYNIFRIHEEQGMTVLKATFPEGLADADNFVLFSTSGVHGTYNTIEDIEKSMNKYGEEQLEEAPDDYHSPFLTILIIQPRIVCMRYGEIKIGLKDISFLKNLRASSIDAVANINSSAVKKE